MKEDKDSVSLPAGGGSTLMVIFAVLCLLTFAVLSIATVTADRRLEEASVKAVEAWYEADTRAEELLFEIRNGTCPEGVTLEGDVFSYSCPIGDNRSLEVELRLEGTGYEILRWQAVNTASGELSEETGFWSMEVMDFG